MALPLALLVAVIAVAWLAWKLWAVRVPSLKQLPVVGNPNASDFSQAILDGYKHYPDTPFIVPADPPRVCLPMSMYAEVVRLPEHQVSFNSELYEIFAGKHTHIGQQMTELVQVVRHDLTKNVPSILSLLQEECDFAFPKELGCPKEWKTIDLYPTLLRIVAYLSARVFVGLPLAHDEDWIKMSIDYTVHMGEISRRTQRIPYIIRPFAVNFLPSVRQAKRDLKRAEQWMGPLVSDCVRQSSDTEKGVAVKAGSRGSFISWLLNYYPKQRQNAEYVGRCQMLASFAAIHTTSLTSAHILLDLASRPEYFQPLREELEEVLAEDSETVDENGRPFINKASFAKLKKLDSFVKESQRMNPLTFITSARRLMVDYTFSNGLKLPKGTRIAFPMWGVYQSDDTPIFSRDTNEKTNNLGPEVFDGFRFARLRDLPGHESKHQSVTTGVDSLNFGHGTHVCPGRFFAIYEIKTLLVEFLRNYDIRLPVPENEDMGKRPPNMVCYMNNNPNFGAKLQVRERQK